MNLALFFSRNISLAIWVELGLFDREQMIYQRHLYQQTFERIYWFTYGPDDLKYLPLVPTGVVIVPMPKFFSFPLGNNLYSLLMPFVQRDRLKQCQVYKTDQMDGSWAAVIARFLFHKPLMIRTGFPLSLFMHRKGRRFKELVARCMESVAYRLCDVATVSSLEAKEFIAGRYRVPDEKIHVMYNYIDTEIFHPRGWAREEKTLLFVGRIEPQKNLTNLVRAAATLGLGLDIYGRGSQKEELVALASALGVSLRFMGQIANNQLAEVYNSYRYFILSSLYEGMPKTLLEAMACGCICIGSCAMGIKEVIRDADNGFLAYGFAAADLVQAIQRAQASNHEVVSIRGVETIAETFSLDLLQRREAQIFMTLMKE